MTLARTLDRSPATPPSAPSWRPPATGPTMIEVDDDEELADFVEFAGVIGRVSPEDRIQGAQL